MTAFWTDESGAVTVGWVAMTAAVAGLEPADGIVSAAQAREAFRIDVPG